MANITAKLYLNDGTSIEFGKRQILEFESLSQSTSDPSSIFYGIVPSTGLIKILDVDKKIQNYIESGQLDASSINIELYANGKLFHKHISTTSDYDNHTQILTIQLSDVLNHWNEVNYNGYYYKDKPETIYEILDNIFLTIGINDINSMLDNDIIYNGEIISIKEYLQSIRVEYPFLPADTFKNTIDKICVIAQLNVITNDDGNIKFISARPINYKQPTIISKNNQYSDLNHSVILKNRYDAIEMNEYDINSHYSIESNAGSMTQKISEYLYNQSGFNIYNETSAGFYYVVKIEGSYTDGEFILDKRNNNGLTKIISLSSRGEKDDDGYINVNFSIGYEAYQYRGDFSNKSELISDLYPYNETSVFAITQYEDNVIFDDEFYSVPTTLPTDVKTNFYVGDDYFTAELKNESYVKVKENEDYYSVKYHILSKSTTYYFLYSYSGVPSILFSNPVSKYIAKYATININGLIFELDFSKILFRSQNISSAKQPISIITSELFENVTTVNSNKISEIIKNNIFSDYSNGISDGELTISCSDYYDEYGNKIIDWANGEMLKVGTEVKIEGNDKLWRITGRKVRKNATPFIDLELMEIKDIGTRDKLELGIDMSEDLDAEGLFAMPVIQSEDFYVDWGDGDKEFISWSPLAISHKYKENDFVGKITIGDNFQGTKYTSNNFLNRYPITYIKIFDGVQTINDKAFQGCVHARTLEIPETIQSIGAEAFQNCYNLEKIFFNAIDMNNTKSDIFTNSGSSTADTKVIFGDKVISVPRYIFSATSAVDFPGIRHISIGNSTKTIKEGAFSGCRSLLDVVIGNGVESIEKYAFFNCETLNYLTLDAKVPPQLGEDAIPSTIQNIIIPAGTKSVYESASGWSVFKNKFREKAQIT